MFASAGIAESLEGFIGVVIVVMIIALFFVGLAVAGYVLRAMSLYTIAKRRGIIHPWLAWIPIGDAWILGGISDQYQYQVKKKVRNRERLLPILNIAMVAMALPHFVTENLLMHAIRSGTADVGMVLPICLYVLYFALSIVTLVFTCIAMYDLYVSCDPDNAVLYLVIGIFFDFIQPLFLFFCRKKDLGLTSREESAQPKKDCAEKNLLL